MARLVGGEDLARQEREAILLDALGGDPARSRRLLERAEHPGDVFDHGQQVMYGTSILGGPKVQLRASTIGASVYMPRWTLLRWVTGQPLVIRRSDASTAAPTFSIG